MLKLWPTHKFICNKHTRIMLDPTMAPMYAMDDKVYMASQVRLGNEDGETPDFWLVLPAGVQRMLLPYLDVKSLCRMDSIMTNVLAREAWNIALRGSESVALSKWPRYSYVDKFKGLRWSMHRRVALDGVRLQKVVNTGGDVFTDVRNQFIALCQQPKFVDIALLLVESRSIDVNMMITAKRRKITFLCVASEEGHLPIVQALLHAGADVDKAADSGWTPLIMASWKGHLPVVQALLQDGADVDKAMDGGWTALDVAKQKKHGKVVSSLQKARAAAGSI